MTTKKIDYNQVIAPHEKVGFRASATLQALNEVSAFSEKYLSDIFRRSGESYAIHCKEVAETITEVSDDTILIRCAYLHDILVHPDGKELLQKSPLTEEEQELVQSMFDLRRLHIDSNTKDLDYVISAFSGDPRLLILRMAHRLNDVRHLDRFDNTLGSQIATETLHMYTAISGRLGFHRWRWQMEDICFKHLQPDIAKRMQERFDASRAADHACLRHAHTFIEKKLKDATIEADIDERIKGLYSTYRKMVLKERTFEQIVDRLALRILVPTVDDCYRALGLIHAHMHPMHGKLKDYIGTPKQNGYKSIHTVVYPLPGLTELPIEVQIRTHAMHDECECGMARHGDYKHQRYALTSLETKTNLLRNLENLHTVLQSRSSFEDALRTSFRDDRLLVFDAENNLYHLKQPATALDFVCHKEPDRCAKITGVKINGRTAELDTELRDGDVVEVVIS